MMTQEEYMDLLALRRQGKTIAEIAEELGYHPATVSGWIKKGGPPPARTIDPAVRVVDGRWAQRIRLLIRPPAEKLLARSVFEIITAEGFAGSYPSVVRHLRDVRGPRFRAAPAVSVPIEPWCTHIIQKLMGHADLRTTQAYAAIFPDDIIRSHRAFIDNRRRLRPSDEYRDITTKEWDDFEEHFAKRKIAIGDCMRAYGTNCVHEYACEQCKLARPDEAAEPRLQRTRNGLLEQLDEARQRGWLGEIERLDHILAAVNDKLGEIDRARRRSTIVDAPRSVRTAAGT